MRKKLYQDILTCLKSLTDENGAPLFKTTGLWSGNSETGTPSVAMPAVLMECGESVWKTLEGGSQEALLTLKLHILTAPTEDTSEDTSTEQILNAFELSGRVYTALLSMRIDRNAPHNMRRTASIATFSAEGFMDNTDTYQLLTVE